MLSCVDMFAPGPSATESAAYTTLTERGLPHEIVMKIMSIAKIDRSVRIPRLISKLRGILLSLYNTALRDRRFSRSIRPYRTANFMRYDFNRRRPSPGTIDVQMARQMREQWGVSATSDNFFQRLLNQGRS